MNLRTMKKLEKLGYDKDWLLVVKSEFKPKKNGYYEIRVTDIKDLSEDPRHGIFIDTTTFCDSHDLSEILRYFEGYSYVLTDLTIMKTLDSGIIDENLFDFMEDYTGYEWESISEEKLDAKKMETTYRNESMIEKLTRENNELMLENAKLKLQLKRYDNDFQLLDK